MKKLAIAFAIIFSTSIASTFAKAAGDKNTLGTADKVMDKNTLGTADRFDKNTLGTAD